MSGLAPPCQTLKIGFRNLDFYDPHEHWRPCHQVGVALSKNLMAIAGDSLKANITTLGPLVLPISEQLLFFMNLIGRKVRGCWAVRCLSPCWQGPLLLLSVPLFWCIRRYSGARRANQPKPVGFDAALDRAVMDLVCILLPPGLMRCTQGVSLRATIARLRAL